jgi:hypothetical protein
MIGLIIAIVAVVLVGGATTGDPAGARWRRRGPAEPDGGGHELPHRRI